MSEQIKGGEFVRLIGFDRNGMIVGHANKLENGLWSTHLRWTSVFAILSREEAVAKLYEIGASSIQESMWE